MKKYKYKHTPGFTIVELLIVVVVIAILAAIALVAYGGVRENAARSAAQSSVGSGGQKVLAFAVENAEQYPDDLTGIGIANTPTTTYDYVVDNTTSPKQYCIQATVQTFTYYVGYSQTTSQWATRPTEGLCQEAWLATAKVKTISAGYDFRCVINNASNAYCAGSNTYGQLGDGTTTSRSPFAAVDTTGVLAGKKIKYLSVGGDGGYGGQHVCAIASDSQVYCWGSNSGGSLGNGTTISSSVPVAIDTSGVLAGKTIKALAVGYGHNCVIASDNQAYCWGGRTYNNEGQLGNGSTTESLVPVAVNTSGVLSGKQIKQISASNNSTCVVASDNLAYCWGKSIGLGSGSASNSSVPTAVNMSGVLSGKTIKSVSALRVGGCAIASDDKVYCWGWSPLGDGTSNASNMPVAVSMGSETATVMYPATSNAYGNATCYGTPQKDIYCWGNTGLSSGSADYEKMSPYKITYPAGLTIERFSVTGKSFEIGYGIASNGNLYVWNNFLAAPSAVSVPW